jgi:hypothetical protein
MKKPRNKQLDFDKEIFDIFLKSFKFYFHEGSGGIENFKKGIYDECTFFKRDIEKNSIAYLLTYKLGWYHLSSFNYRSNSKDAVGFTDFNDLVKKLSYSYPKEFETYNRRMKIKKLLNV